MSFLYYIMVFRLFLAIVPFSLVFIRRQKWFILLFTLYYLTIDYFFVKSIFFTAYLVLISIPLILYNLKEWKDRFFVVFVVSGLSLVFMNNVIIILMYLGFMNILYGYRLNKRNLFFTPLLFLSYFALTISFIFYIKYMGFTWNLCNILYFKSSYSLLILLFLFVAFFLKSYPVPVERLGKKELFLALYPQNIVYLYIIKEISNFYVYLPISFVFLVYLLFLVMLFITFIKLIKQKNFSYSATLLYNLIFTVSILFVVLTKLRVEFFLLDSVFVVGILFILDRFYIVKDRFVISNIWEKALVLSFILGLFHLYPGATNLYILNILLKSPKGNSFFILSVIIFYIFSFGIVGMRLFSKYINRASLNLKEKGGTTAKVLFSSVLILYTIFGIIFVFSLLNSVKDIIGVSFILLGLLIIFTGVMLNKSRIRRFKNIGSEDVLDEIYNSFIIFLERKGKKIKTFFIAIEKFFKRVYKGILVSNTTVKISTFLKKFGLGVVVLMLIILGIILLWKG